MFSEGDEEMCEPAEIIVSFIFFFFFVGVSFHSDSQRTAANNTTQVNQAQYFLAGHGPNTWHTCWKWPGVIANSFGSNIFLSTDEVVADIYYY